MNRTLSEAQVVSDLASQLCRKIIRRVVLSLQKMTEGMQSGDDSGLRNIWDEICVQRQDEPSVFWELYDDVAQQLVQKEIRSLLPFEKEAVWLQTDPALDWTYEEEEERDAYPVSDKEIVRYILDSHLYEEARSWSNHRIEKYLNDGHGFG